MLDTVGKLFQSSIFPACQIFESGPESKLPAAEIIVPQSPKFCWGTVKELIYLIQPDHINRTNRTGFLIELNRTLIEFSQFFKILSSIKFD